MADQQNIHLRKAGPEDMATVFQWRNDPLIASLGSLKTTVSWEEHKQWFLKTLASDDAKMFIIERNGNSIGQIRFMRTEENNWTVSIYLLQPYTGKGFGVAALAAGCREISNRYPGAAITAYILRDNRFSHSAFLKAGFQEALEGDQNHLIFVYRAPRPKGP